MKRFLFARFASCPFLFDIWKKCQEIHFEKKEEVQFFFLDHNQERSKGSEFYHHPAGVGPLHGPDGIKRGGRIQTNK